MPYTVLTPAAFETALAALEQAVALDPDYSLAWSILGHLHADNYALGFKAIASPLDKALAEEEFTAAFLGEVPGFRPPTKTDILSNPKRGMWVSQPTGMDISPDGRMAAVITYRSLYLFRRAEGETWLDAFNAASLVRSREPGNEDAEQLLHMLQAMIKQPQ